MIRSAPARSVLSKTSGFLALAGFSHSLNPARNCLFGCTYCYVPTLRVRGGLRLEDWTRWGRFTTLKANAPSLLARELRGGERIYCSPLVDPYQPSESAAELIRGILDALLAAPPARRPLALCVQTRGTAVVRDAARLAAVRSAGVRVRVSFSVTTDPSNDDEIRRAYEPKCASIRERLSAIRALRESGVETIATLAPILPCDPEALLDAVADATDPATPIVADPFHIAGTKRGAVTRPEALRLSARRGWARWHDPSFQAEVCDRLRRRAAQRGRRIEFRGFGLRAARRPLTAVIPARAESRYVRRVTSPGFWAGFYRLADPKITLASVASMVLGLGLAASRGGIDWGWFAAAAFAVFCLEAAKNASGEVFDWDSGDDQAVGPEDRSPFSGGKRVLVDGLMTRSEVIRVAALAYGAGIAMGLVIAALREPRVLFVGLAGVALAWSYHAPPLKLSYRGLGELAVALAYGPLILSGAYLVLRRDLPADVVLAGVPLGLAIAAFLWINEFPDRRADALASKKTLVVRLGARRAAIGFAALLAAAYGLVAVAPLLGAPPGFRFGLIGLPVAAAAAWRVVETQETRLVIPAQAWTLTSFLLMASGSAFGVYTESR